MECQNGSERKKRREMEKKGILIFIFVIVGASGKVQSTDIIFVEQSYRKRHLYLYHKEGRKGGKKKRIL